MAGFKLGYLREHTVQLGHFAALAYLIVTITMAHPGHDDHSSNEHAPISSNWGRLLYRAAEEFQLARNQELSQYLVKNHGGSVYDPITGTLFTTIGSKVIQFKPHEKQGTILSDSEEFGVGNFHGLALASGGAKPSFYFADNVRHFVRYRSYADSVSKDFSAGAELGEYYAKGGSFNPTDVEIDQMTRNPWAFDGYGSSQVFDLTDTDQGFGGKSVFKTAHGGATFGENWVVCSRGSGEICTVNAAGLVIERFSTGLGTMPCDIDFIGDFALVGCLRGPANKEESYPGAPCFIYHWPSKQLLSTLIPKSDFGFKNGTHIHNAAWWPHYRNGRVSKLFIALSFWNPGDFKLVEVDGIPVDWLTIASSD